MQASKLDDGPFCLGVDVNPNAGDKHDTMGNYLAFVGLCSRADLMQGWTQEPNGPGGHRYHHGPSDKCMKWFDSSRSGAPNANTVKMGPCNDDLPAGWFEDAQAFPRNLLRNIVDDPDDNERKCLSAISKGDLPGKHHDHDASVCQQVMQLLPNVSVPSIGPIHAPAGVTVTIKDLTLQLPHILKNFNTCGFYDEGPGGLASHKGTLTLDMDIPEVPFKVPHWHFERPPFHGSGSADGWVNAVIRLKVDYDLAHPNLKCNDFNIDIPDVHLEMHGGGAWHPIVKDVTGAIKSVIKSEVPKLANPAVCPIIDDLAQFIDQCSDAASQGPVAFVLCVLGIKPPSTAASLV